MHPHLERILVYLEESRLVMNWIDVVDIAVIAAFLSIALVWLRRRTARAILFALVPLVVTYGAARHLKMYLTSQLFQVGLTAFLVSIVIIFQDDFRRTFEGLAAWRLWGKREGRLANKLADLLAECLGGFSKSQTGALVILQGRQSLEPHIRQGIVLRGQPSIPLLQSIFDPHSAGHDGGVTIVDGKVDMFGVHLPLSRNSQETGRLGTRHAAALGLAEKCDALVLVVSEETGTISLARNGQIQPLRSANAVRDAVKDHYRRLGPMPHRSLFEIPWGRLVTSGVLACGLWLVFARPHNLIQRLIEVPIVYRSVPKGWEARPPEPLKVKLTLFGPEGPVMSMDPTVMALAVDLQRIKDGAQRFVLSESALALPPRVRVKRIEPSEVSVTAYATVDSQVPVEIIWRDGAQGRAPNSALRITPPQVSLRLPRGRPAPRRVETEPVDAAELKKAGRLKVKLRLPEEAQMADMGFPEVDIGLAP